MTHVEFLVEDISYFNGIMSKKNRKCHNTCCLFITFDAHSMSNSKISLCYVTAPSPHVNWFHVAGQF